MTKVEGKHDLSIYDKYSLDFLSKGVDIGEKELETCYDSLRDVSKIMSGLAKEIVGGWEKKLTENVRDKSDKELEPDFDFTVKQYKKDALLIEKIMHIYKKNTEYINEFIHHFKQKIARLEKQKNYTNEIIDDIDNHIDSKMVNFVELKYGRSFPLPEEPSFDIDDNKKKIEDLSSEIVAEMGRFRTLVRDEYRSAQLNQTNEYEYNATVCKQRRDRYKESTTKCFQKIDIIDKQNRELIKKFEEETGRFKISMDKDYDSLENSYKNCETQIEAYRNKIASIRKPKIQNAIMQLENKIKEINDNVNQIKFQIKKIESEEQVKLETSIQNLEKKLLEDKKSAQQKFETDSKKIHDEYEKLIQQKLDEKDQKAKSLDPQSDIASDSEYDLALAKKMKELNSNDKKKIIQSINNIEDVIVLHKGNREKKTNNLKTKLENELSNYESKFKNDKEDLEKKSREDLSNTTLELSSKLISEEINLTKLTEELEMEKKELESIEKKTSIWSYFKFF